VLGQVFNLKTKSKMRNKFKAVSMSGADVVCGSLIHSMRFEGCSNEYRIHEINSGIESDVYPETIRQFTGFYDKNGKEIFEGDVVLGYKNIFKATVEWNNSFCGFYPFCNEKTGIFNDECEIIGNIHEEETI
jgi:uncharacterized phage protein (TIGR01671 family)